MYSLVLMTAFTTATVSPGFGILRGGNHGGYAANYGCSGCYGCGGCNGGSWTYAEYGGAGPGYGYHGGCYGAYGSWYGHTNGFGCTGCYGCHGGYSCYGIPVPGGIPGTPSLPLQNPINPTIPRHDKGGKTPETIGNPPEKKIDQPSPDIRDDGARGDLRDEIANSSRKHDALAKNKKNQLAAPIVAVKLRIDVPAGGKLYVDGRHIHTGEGLQTFNTPPLAMDHKYYYNLRIEIERNGQILSENRRIIIQSAQDIDVAFRNLIRQETDFAQTNK